MLTISGKIAENDLKSKLHSVEKWLKKGHQTKVTLSSRGCTSDDLVSCQSRVQIYLTEKDNNSTKNAYGTLPSPQEYCVIYF